MTSKFDFLQKGKSCGYMELTDNNTSGNNKLYIYGDVHLSEDYKLSNTDVCPQDISDFFASIDDTLPLDLYINSGGGSIFGGFAIYNILKRYKGHKTAHIDGLAASISSVIPFACDKVTGTSASMIMIHKPSNIVWGNADEMRKGADDLDKMQEAIIDVYCENAVDGVSRETINEMVNSETWLTCEQAKDYFRVEVEKSNAPVNFAKSELWKNYKNAPDFPQKSSNNDNGDTSNDNKMQICLVTGAPCSGKSTYVRDNAQENDVIYDYDNLVRAMSTRQQHLRAFHPCSKFVMGLKFRLSDIAKSGVNKMWIITTKTSDDFENLIKDYPVERINIDTDKEECLKRLENDENRPDKEEWRDAINRYFGDTDNEDQKSNKLNLQLQLDLIKLS